MAIFDAGLSVKNKAKLLCKKVSDGLQSGDGDESKKKQQFTDQPNSDRTSKIVSVVKRKVEIIKY